jgi:hypothetical protein
MTESPSAAKAPPPPGEAASRRFGAYVLLADPAYLHESLVSYYDIVDTIVVAFDEDSISWTGEELDIEPCRSVVEGLDREHKVRWLPGRFHGGGRAPLEAETFERNAAISALGDSVDWILQIDTDEVLSSPARLLESVRRADAHGLSAVEFPARWLYGHIGGLRYLERCRRLWGVSAGFPGPVAVRAGTELRLARQCDAPPWRVDFRARNTDPAHPWNARVDESIDPEEGIWHFSWVRSGAQMRGKASTSGHAAEFDWHTEIDRWLWRCRHPRLTTLGTPLRRPPSIVGAPTWLRIARLPAHLGIPTR